MVVDQPADQLVDISTTLVTYIQLIDIDKDNFPVAVAQLPIVVVPLKETFQSQRESATRWGVA